MTNNYNYVVLNSYDKLTSLPNKDSYIDICVRDLYGRDDIKVINLPLQGKSSLLRFIYAIHNSERVNKLLRMPFKNIWYPFLLSFEFKNNRPICFVLLETRFREDFLLFLKEKYTNCKIVALHRDFIHKSGGLKLNRLIDIEMTYDKGESVRYNMPVFSEFESKVDIKAGSVFESDVFFAGRAKDRLPDLLKAYDLFTKNGLRVYYFLTSVPKEEQVDLPGIEYAERYMTYEEMLYHTVNTRCVLEIIQGGGQTGYTSRFLESVIYGKKLLTNCKSVKESKFYAPDKIQVISKISDINVNFIKEGNGFVSYNYNGEFSPLRVIERIDEELNKKYQI